MVLRIVPPDSTVVALVVTVRSTAAARRPSTIVSAPAMSGLVVTVTVSVASVLETRRVSKVSAEVPRATVWSLVPSKVTTTPVVSREALLSLEKLPARVRSPPRSTLVLASARVSEPLRSAVSAVVRVAPPLRSVAPPTLSVPEVVSAPWLVRVRAPESARASVASTSVLAPSTVRLFRVSPAEVSIWAAPPSRVKVLEPSSKVPPVKSTSPSTEIVGAPALAASRVPSTSRLPVAVTFDPWRSSSPAVTTTLPAARSPLIT